MKKIYYSLTLVVFLCLTALSIETKACTSTEQDNKALTEFICPNDITKKYKKCVGSMLKCCDALDAISCPPNNEQ